VLAMKSVNRSIVRVRRVPVTVLLWILATSLMMGCNDKGTNNDGPPLRPWIERPSCSWADDFVYFEYVGDTAHPQGIYRAHLSGEGKPELVAIAGVLATASPCGTRLAYRLYQNLMVKTFDGGDPLDAPAEVIIPADSSGGVDAIGWHGCDTVLYHPVWEQGISQVDLRTRAIERILDWGRNPTSPHGGSLIAFESGATVLTLQDGDIDTIVAFPSPDVIRGPRVSPDGTEIAFGRTWSRDTSGIVESGASVEVVELKTGEMRTIAQIALRPAWTADGDIVYVDFRESHYHELWITDRFGASPRKLLDYKAIEDM
jgi:hypothetical protein